MASEDTGVQRACHNCQHPIVQTYDWAEEKFGWRHINVAGCDAPTPPPPSAVSLLPHYYRLGGPCSGCGRDVPIACLPEPDEINLWAWYCHDCATPAHVAKLIANSKRPGPSTEHHREAQLWAAELITSGVAS